MLHTFLSLAYKALHGLAPAHLASLILHCSPSWTFHFTLTHHGLLLHTIVHVLFFAWNVLPPAALHTGPSLPNRLAQLWKVHCKHPLLEALAHVLRLCPGHLTPLIVSLLLTLLIYTASSTTRQAMSLLKAGTCFNNIGIPHSTRLTGPEMMLL